MMDLFDVEATERIESEIDAFISKRSRERKEANAEEEAWKESTRRVNETRRRANRQAWIDHFGHMNRLHLSLAAEDADKRVCLLAESGYEPDEGPDAA
jgi:hypothetical protein